MGILDAPVTRERIALTDYSKLLPWFAALAHRNDRRVNIAFAGASIAEGYPNAFAYNQQMALQAILSARFPTSGLTTHGRGYVGTPSPMEVGAWPLTFTGGTFDSAVFNFGAKHECWYSSTAGNKVVDTLPAPVTSFDINIIAGSSGNANGGYYKIDGGTAVTFSTYTSASSKLSKIHVASPATTSIEVGCNLSGQYIVFEGITEYAGDENKGIQVHNCGHASMTLQQWNAGAGATGWNASIAALSPDLVIWGDAGLNDYVTTIGNRTPAQYKADLIALIANLRAVGITCPILVALTWEINISSYTYAGNWADYRAATYEVASADPTVLVLDQSTRMPTPNGGSQYGLYQSDKLHGTAAGYQMLAQTLAEFIKPR